MIKFVKWFKIKGKTEQKEGHNDARPGLFIRKGKGKVFPVITIIQVSMITATVSPILNLSTIWRWVVNLTPRLLSTWERTLVTSALQAGCYPELVRTFWETKNFLSYRELNHGLSLIAMLTMPHQLSLHEKSVKNTTDSNSILVRKDGRTSANVYSTWHLWTLGVRKKRSFYCWTAHHSRADITTLAQQPMMLPTLQCPVARLPTLEQATSLWRSNQWCRPVYSAQLPDNSSLKSRQHHSGTATNDAAHSAVPSCWLSHSRSDDITLAHQPMMQPSCWPAHSRSDDITLAHQPMMPPSLQCPVQQQK
jgi:hypothetical protein